MDSYTLNNYTTITWSIIPGYITQGSRNMCTEILTTMLPTITINDIGEYSENRNILDSHPLIKSTTKTSTIGEYNIKTQNYSINTRNAKQHGIKTISDDGVYEALPYMHKLCPRGLSFVEITHNGTTESTVFYGFRKFGGMEDDSECLVGNPTRYFREGDMSLVTHFMETEKSNGENAKWTIRRLHGIMWYLAGSKNTCIVWPISGNPPNKIQGDKDYGNIIAHQVSTFVLSDEVVNWIVDNQVVVMGELNHVMSEHVFPINKTLIEHVGILDRSGVEIADAFTLLESWGLTVVKHRFHDISRLEEVTEEIYNDTTNEGRVINFLDANNKCLALVKYKTCFYVLWRRIRQNFWRHLVEPTAKYPTFVCEFAKKCENALKIKIPQLTFLPDCKEKSDEWVETATNFVWWWVQEFQNSGSKKPDWLHMSQNKYGTIVQKYLESTDVVVNKPSGTTNDDDDRPKIVLLRGPSGCGKTTRAKELAQELGGSVCSADDYFESIGGYDMKQLETAHKYCQKQVLQAIRENKVPIVANTNIKLWEMISYVRISIIFNMSVTIEVVDNTGWTKDGNAKILSNRSASNDTWRESTPIDVVKRHITGFEPCNNGVVDILTANVPRHIKLVPTQGVYDQGGYVGFSHPVFTKWVFHAATFLGLKTEYVDKCLMRDGFVKHVTLAVWNQLPKDLQKSEFMWSLQGLIVKDFIYRGTGYVESGDNKSWYVALESDKMNQIYDQFQMPRKTLHITIGYITEDIHGVLKLAK